MLEAANVTSTIFALLIGTAVFTYFLALSRLPIELAEWIVSLSISPRVIVAVFLLILIPLGMLLDGLSIMLLVVPVVYPALAKLGVDGVWLGILIVTMIELGLILPPVGINVYVIAGLIEDLSLEDAFAGSASFIWIHLIVTAVLFIFPEIVLFLPRMAAGAG
jgi:TRAP-type C4-dicarboxylate transport system permease large subunit